MKRTNIDQFNALTGILLATLYEAFPRCFTVNHDSFGIDCLGESDFDGAFDWGDFVKESVTWLDAAGYIWIKENAVSWDSTSVRLSPAGLQLLKSMPASLQLTEAIGERLRRFSKERAIEGIQQLVSQIISLGIAVTVKNTQLGNP